MQVLVPGVAQLTAAGTYETQPWAITTHWQYPGNNQLWSNQNLQVLVNAFRANWNSQCGPLMVNVVNTNTFTAVDLGDANLNTAQNAQQVTGQRTGNIPGTTSNCMLISERINSRYRGGHPRIYLPWGANGDMANGYQWTLGFTQAASQGFANLVNQIVLSLPTINGTSVAHCAVRYTYQYIDDPVHHKYRKQRNGLLGTFVIQTYVSQTNFGTQRRRLTT